MRKLCLAIAAATLGLAASPAFANDKTVIVSAKSIPWDVGVNPKFDFGQRGGRAPKVVFDILFVPGSKMRFSATGSTTTVAGGGSFGPEGQEGFATDGNRGNSGAYFPSASIDKAAYPVLLNELLGAFVTADGTIVGKPFPIGAGAEVEVPKGAVALSLGLNDDIFSDNTGELTVTINYIQPTVEIEKLGTPN